MPTDEQLAQLDELDAPTALDEVPAEHCVHAVEPVEEAKVPAGHRLQYGADATDANDPTAHGEHDVEPGTEDEPAAQGRQVELETALAVLDEKPPGQRVNGRAPPLQKPPKELQASGATARPRYS